MFKSKFLKSVPHFWAYRSCVPSFARITKKNRKSSDWEESLMTHRQTYRQTHRQKDRQTNTSITYTISSAG